MKTLWGPMTLKGCAIGGDGDNGNTHDASPWQRADP
jgi:hypothetical protein